MIYLDDLLKIKGLDARTTNVKIVRHQDKNNKINELYNLGYFETFQSYQPKPVFDDCEYVVSFIGTESTKAVLVGVYKLVGKKKIGADLADPPFLDKFRDLLADFRKAYYYELVRQNDFNDYVDRLVIEWGSGARAWCQRLHTGKKEVIEIRPQGYVKRFSDYLDFVLTYDELVKIIHNKDANKEWHLLLSSVAGVYLIVDSKTGLQYIGSAYGEKGILGRWEFYAQNPDGGNMKLRDILQKEGQNYARNFSFTILQTLPRTLTKNEVITHEINYKNKLGSRAFGLNSN